MKRLIALVFCIVLSFSTLALGADFVKVTMPTKATINKIIFLDSNFGFAVTSDGELLKTKDGGQTWKSQNLSKRAITDIHILGRVGYLTGEKGLLMKSEDAGASWKDMSLDLKFNFSGIGILDDTLALVCGTDQNSMSKVKGVLYKTFNGGKTWEKQPHQGNGYMDIVANPPRKVYLLAIKKAFHSINYGEYFFRGSYEGDRLGLAFDFQDDWGFMVGSEGLFARSETHGRKWEEVPIDITKSLMAVGMIDHYSGVAVGQSGIVLTFSDSGDRYTVENVGENVDLKAVCITDTRILCGGMDGAFFYRDRFPRAQKQ